MVKAASTVSRDIRGDNYGKLEGYWLTEIGPLNQVMHLWSYGDFSERARLRGRTRQEPALERRVHSADPSAADAPGHPSAQRDQAAGGAGLDRQHLRAPQLSRQAAAVRSSNGSMRSPRCCRRARNIPRSSACGRPRRASPTRCATSGPIPSLNARAEARANAMNDPAWQEFLGKGPPLLEEMHSTIMLPAPHSPLK